MINDGSSDLSGEVCESYATKNERIIVIHKPNDATSLSCKVGISVASGNYVMLGDEDDWIDTINCIENESDLQCVLFSYIKEHPNKSIPVKALENNQLFIGIKLKIKYTAD